MDRASSLIKEASRIATQINNDRLCGIVPESDLTVRLTEICDLLNDLQEKTQSCAQKEDEDDGIQCYINGKPVTREEFIGSYR